jgi:hypothetical protein
VDSDYRFASFFSNTAERFRILFDSLRLDHLLFNRQLLRPAFSALVFFGAPGDPDGIPLTIKNQVFG